MAIPILAPNSTWYKSSTSRSTITQINIVDSYTPTGSENETWNADTGNTGSIKCYRTGTVITIAGNGSGKIAANADSSLAFASFSVLASITGFGLLDTGGVINMYAMVGNNPILTTIDVSNWDTSLCTNMAFMFMYDKKLISLDLSDWDTSKVTSMEQMFFGDYDLSSIGNISGWDTSKVTSMQHMFSGCQSLSTIDIGNWDTGNVTTMSDMFDGCSSLVSIGNISNWNVSAVKLLCAMFQGCSNLEELSIKNWNPSSCTDMSFMFYGFKKNGNITLDVSNWDVSKVTNFDHMFAHSGITVVGVGNWVTTSATNFYGMFHSTKNTSFNVSNFDTSNVTVFGQMFECCYALQEIIGLENFDTSNGIDFAEMFAECSRIKKLNLSSFDTRKAKNGVTVSTNGGTSETLARMFAFMADLEEITLGENFSFSGDGTAAASYHAVLPTPSSGYWYTEDGTQYAPDAIPTLTAATYYASLQRVDETGKPSYLDLLGFPKVCYVPINGVISINGTIGFELKT